MAVKGPVTADQGVRIVNLGTLVATQTTPGPGAGAPPPNDYVVGFVAFFASDASARVTPDPAKLFATDTLGNHYGTSYTEIARRDGVTVAAISFTRLQGARKTLALQISGLQLSQATRTPVTVSGQWQLRLITQVVDTPAASMLTGELADSPAEANGVRVRIRLGGAGPEGTTAAVEIERPSAAAETVYIGITRPNGAVRELTRYEFDHYFDRAGVPTPRPYTPAPEAPKPGSTTP